MGFRRYLCFETKFRLGGCLHELEPGGAAVAVLWKPRNPNARSNEVAIENAAGVIGLKLAFMWRPSRFLRARLRHGLAREAAHATRARVRLSALRHRPG